MHDTAFNQPVDDNPAHLGPAFCPWHRYFLARFEQDLQHADTLEGGDGTLMLPYWDWVNDNAKTPNRQRGQIWDEAFMGGDGTPVTNGPFRDGGGWTTVGGIHKLVRTFGVDIPELPRQAAVDLAMASEGLTRRDSTTRRRCPPGSRRRRRLRHGRGRRGARARRLPGRDDVREGQRPDTPLTADGHLPRRCVRARERLDGESSSSRRPPVGRAADGYRVYVSPVGGAPGDALLESGTTSIGTPTTIRSLTEAARSARRRTRPAASATSSRAG